MDGLSVFNFGEFWEESEYARKTYLALRPGSETIAKVEAKLGVHLPRAYITLA